MDFIVQNLSWIITSIVTIFGFIITIYITNKNFKNELKKTKNLEAIKKLDNISKILADSIKKLERKQFTNNNFLDNVIDMFLYGSEDLSKIVYDYIKGEYEKNDILIYHAILIAQIKYETTGNVLKPFFWLNFKSTNLYGSDIELNHKINQIIRRKHYNKLFLYRIKYKNTIKQEVQI